MIKWDDLAAKGPALFPRNLDWDTQPPITPDEDGTYEHSVPMPGIYRPF